MLKVVVADVAGWIERVAPLSWAEPWDRVGLQVGDPNQPVRRILTALELTEEVLRETLDTEANLLVLHHPIIFEPLSSLTAVRPVERRIRELIRNEISVYVAHTNFDASEQSMSAEMLRAVGVPAPRKAVPKPSPGAAKIVVFCPPEATPKVREAMAAQGAGVIGEYDLCSFHSSGTGTFRGSDASHPAIGEAGRFEETAEERLEMLCPPRRLPQVTAALVAAHPYEEPAYEVYALEENRSPLQYVRLGELPTPKPLRDLADEECRCIGDPNRTVRKLASASGSGRSLLSAVSELGVDAFLTGDLGHHDARNAEDLGLSVLDVGHFRSEVAFGDIMARLIQERLPRNDVAAAPSRRIRGPWIPLR